MIVVAKDGNQPYRRCVCMIHFQNIQELKYVDIEDVLHILAISKVGDKSFIL